MGAGSAALSGPDLTQGVPLQAVLEGKPLLGHVAGAGEGTSFLPSTLTWPSPCSSA